MNKEKHNFDERDLRLLNSNKGIKLMLQGLEPNKALRYVKYEREIENLQVELIKLQNWVIQNKKRVVV